jgi:hypothetical protein
MLEDADPLRIGVLRTDPRRWTPSSVTRKSGSSWICWSFSSSVIFASSAFTRESTWPSAGFRVGWSACSSLDCVAATTPPAIAVPSTRIETASQSLGLNLDMGVPFPVVGLDTGERYPRCGE